MKIAYIKLDKPKEGILGNILYKIRIFFNYIYQDKFYKERYYIANTNEKSINKLINILKKNKVDYVIEENGININYPKLRGNYSLKYMLKETVKYCFRLTNLKVEEIFITVNRYTEENVQIIKDLAYIVKGVNIVSENTRYLNLEKELENNGVYITVNNNKRKSLKRANIVVNLDFKNFNQYAINRSMIIIDTSQYFNIRKGFDGIYIKGIKIKTDKIMRVFSEYENFNKDNLIEAEMIKINKYDDVRKYIEINKFEISEVIGERIIVKEEFKRIEKMII